MNHTPVPLASFRIRPLRRGDAAPVMALLADAGYRADAQVVTWIVSHPEMEAHVAADALDKAIGIVTLSHRPQLRFGGRIATIDELVVAEVWRRRGVGSELLRKVMQRCQILSVKKLEVQSMGVASEAVEAMAKKHGFEKSVNSLFLR